MPSSMHASIDWQPACSSLAALERSRQRLNNATEEVVLKKMEDAWALVKHNKLNHSPEVFRSTLSNQGVEELANLAADALALRWWRVLGIVLRTMALMACDDEIIARQVDSTGILRTAAVALVEVGEVRFLNHFALVCFAGLLVVRVTFALLTTYF